MPYPQAATECGACGRMRESVIVPPPITESARPEAYRNPVPPLMQRVTTNDGLTVGVVILIALIITYVRLNYGL